MRNWEEKEKPKERRKGRKEEKEERQYLREAQMKPEMRSNHGQRSFLLEASQRLIPKPLALCSDHTSLPPTYWPLSHLLQYQIHLMIAFVGQAGEVFP